MDNQIKIAFYDDQALSLMINPYHPSGGAAKQVLAWRKGLSEIGYETKLIGSHKNVKQFEQDKTIIISYNPNLGIKLIRYFYIRIPALFLAVKKSRCNYLYYGIPGHFTGLLALVARICGKKFILRISNDYLVDNRYRKQTDIFRYLFYLLAFKFANFVICQNTYQLNQLSKKYSGKTYLLKNPYIGKINNTPFKMAQREYVAWVGIMQHQKNIPLLLSIAAEMPTIEFKIAGNVSSRLNDEGLKALNSLKKLPNVEMLGFINAEEVQLLLKGAIFLLNTSHYEGFSNTFLEAFSEGTPVLTLKQNDPGGIIADNDLGYIFRDAVDLKSAYIKMTTDEYLYHRLSKNCIDYMLREHDLHKQCKEFVQILQNNIS